MATRAMLIRDAFMLRAELAVEQDKEEDTSLIQNISHV